MDNIKPIMETKTPEDAHLEKLARLQADFENYRRRNAGLTLKVQKETEKSLLLQLLPIRDNLMRALNHADDDESLREGVEKILHQFDSVLLKYGVEEIIAVPGTLFDPTVHEATAAVPDVNAVPNTIARELQKGYRWEDSVLRPAQVEVYVGE